MGLISASWANSQTITLITNSGLCRTKFVILIGRKFFVYYIKLHGYNDATFVMNKY